MTSMIFGAPQQRPHHEHEKSNMKGKQKGSRREIEMSETALLAAALTSTDYPMIDMKDKTVPVLRPEIPRV